MRVLKGHGTGNDFVIVPDLDGDQPLTPELVRVLCDRHFGIGADGVLRVVRTKAMVAEDPNGGWDVDAEFAMDYRNSDGSLAEMCGNGARVFARYLRSTDLVGAADFAIATRGGLREIRLVDDVVTVRMGRPEFLDVRPVVSVGGREVGTTLAALTIPNPHVVIELPSGEALADLELWHSPSVVPALPTGQNVEFIARVGAVEDRHLAMRVHERGSGETLSCGTGICAVAVAVAGRPDAADDVRPWRIDVPGGTCWVSWLPDGEVELTGPATIVAEIDLDPRWLASGQQPTG